MTGRLSKGEQRKLELIDHALACLAKKGYAETSLRDIAAAANLNLGRLHYYFGSRTELLLHAIVRYKSRFLEQLDAAVETARTPRALRDELIDIFTVAATRNAYVHRLWYDVKSRSLFDPSLQQIVDDIDTALRNFLTRALQRLGEPTDAHAVERSYYLLDAFFFQAIADTVRGKQGVPQRFVRQAKTVLKTKASANQPPAR